jgi:hypothetical protein
MKRTIIFVVIVTLVSSLTSFVLAALAAGSGREPNTTFVGMALGMAAGTVYMLFSQNRAVKIASDDVRRATLAAPPPGDRTARLIVVRESAVGMMIGVDVIVDGATMTQLKSPRFAVLTLGAGHHEIVALSQGRRTDPITIDIAAGETAVFRIKAGLGGIKLALQADSAELRRSLAKVPMVEAVLTA